MMPGGLFSFANRETAGMAQCRITMPSLSETSQRFRDVVTRVGRGELSREIGYEQLATELQDFVRQCGYEHSLAGYLTAGCHLGDEAYPDRSLKGVPFVASRLPVVEDTVVCVARGLGMFLAAAMAYASDEEQRGSKKVNKHLERSGFYPHDVRE
jgi:hypothetical protein